MPDPHGNWLIQIPLDELKALQDLPREMAQLKAENIQLRRELDGARGMLSEAIQLFGDLRREVAAFRRELSRTLK